MARLGAHPIEDARKGPYKSYLALTANVRLGWKFMSGTNTLAYYRKDLITYVKKLYGISPGVSMKAMEKIWVNLDKPTRTNLINFL